MSSPNSGIPVSRIYVILILATLLCCFLLGRRTAKEGVTYTHTETVWKTDTLTVHDTIRIDRPVPVTRLVHDSIYIRIHDTVYVSLPKEVKVYEDERYRAEVSGYQPSLDRIDIFVAEKVITQDRTQVVTEKMRKHSLGVGIEANYETAFRMPVQVEYGYKMNRVLTAYGYVEYELFTRQCGVGIGISANIEF